jgi:hypothetical protein
MDTFLKIDSTNSSSQCNQIDPFFFNDMKGGVNPETGREFTDKELKNVKSTLYRMSNAKGGKLGVCCDPNDSYDNIDQTHYNNFKKTYPRIKLLKRNGALEGILLSKTANISGEDWIEPTPYHVCKVSKATIIDSKYPDVKIATRLVKNCFTDSCDNTEMINFNQVIGKSITEEQGYTSFDDARVTQAIREGNITFLKKFIRKYRRIDGNLTNTDYGNRLLHIAAEVEQSHIMELLLALKPDINITNTLNQTPLHNAVIHNRYTNAESLIKLGAEMKIRDNNGNTPIFYAIKNGNFPMLRLLYSSGAGLLNKNKQLDNALHHCVKHCPNNKDTIAIYRFLIERGVPIEQINNDEKTPLELIKEKMDTHLKKENFNVTEIDVKELDPEYQKLLEIQTILFNAVIRNNPNKYNNYINVSEVPKGAPIEVLDTLCVGEGNITGNESSQECINKGGKIITIKEPSTKIKIELLPESEKVLDTVNQEELYLIQNPNSINNPKTSPNIKHYNKKLKSTVNSEETNEGMVRNTSLETNQPNQLTNQVLNNQLEKSNTNDDDNEKIEVHPHIYSEDSEENQKEKETALQNKYKIAKKGNNEKDTKDISLSKRMLRLVKKYKYVTLVISLILLIVVIYVIMKYIIPKFKTPEKQILRTI